ncbi:MAG: glycosyltransferase family 39 protein, partial [Myxococcota bacterium]
MDRTPTRRVLAHLILAGMILCVLLLLAIAFAGGLNASSGYPSLRTAWWVLIGLALLYALLERQSLLSALRRAAAGQPAARGRGIEAAAVAGLVLVGFALRIAHVHEFWFSGDEVYFVWMASSDSLVGVWKHVTLTSPHPPANSFMLQLMMKLSRDLFWLRLPSILGGTFVIWISYRYARELFGLPAALAMATLVAFSPALVDLSRVCRNYAVGFAVMVAALFFFVRFLRRGSWRDFLAFALLEP